MNYNPKAHTELKDDIVLKPFCRLVSCTERHTETKGTASSGGIQLSSPLCEFEASLVYRVSSKIARDTQREHVSKNKQKEQQQKSQRNKGNEYPETPFQGVHTLTWR